MDGINFIPIGEEKSYKEYLIDSNILIEMSRFYYYGKCSNYISTQDMKEAIINIRQNGMLQYSTALLELSFDFGANQINTDVMNKFMIAIDELIIYLNEKSIINHTNEYIPFSKQRETDDSIKHIIGCNLPSILQNHPKTQLDQRAFYLEYLYFLKINELYRTKLTGIEKLKALFYYMIDNMGCLSSYAFHLGVILFVGNETYVNTAKGILKPHKKLTFKRVINSLLDIYLFRRALDLEGLFRRAENLHIQKAHQPVIVTGDKNLKNFINTNRNAFTGMVDDVKVCITQGYFELNSIYQKDFDFFYNNRLQPIIKKRHQAHLNNNLHPPTKELIFDEIFVLENKLYI